MAADTSSLSWLNYLDGTGLENGVSESDLLWTKGEDDNCSLPLLTNIDTHELMPQSGGASSVGSAGSAGSSSYSDSSAASSISSAKMGSKTLAPSDTFNGEQDLSDDLWFMPSPDPKGTLQRKKRTHFAEGIKLPSTISRTEQDPGDLHVSSPAASAMLKNHKSVPNLIGGRRVSSGYTARLEDLLAEMGWPKEGGMPVQSADTSVGDETISANNGKLVNGATNDEPIDSALYQRRAQNRADGEMPQLENVAVPIQNSRAESSKNPFSMAMAAQSSSTSQRAAAFAAQHQRLQYMAEMVHSTSSASNARTGLIAGGENELIASKSMHTPSISPAQMLYMPTPTPCPDSTNSSHSELQTPISPFVKMSLRDKSIYSTPSINSTMGKLEDHSAGGYNSAMQNSLGLYNVASVSAPPSAVNPSAVLDPATFAMMFGDLASTPSIANDPSTQFALQAAAAAYHQKLVFPPQQQKVVPVGQSVRPRAGTAMAAIGGGAHNTPRQMRSTPNLQLAHSGSLDGSSHPNIPTPASPTTPVKSIRKIASNRRLNAQLLATPETPSLHLLNGHIPPSPMGSPIKRERGLTESSSYGNLAASAAPSTMFKGAGAFEFINYGIEDADELCSAVAPSGSYKVPLKGYGDADGLDDDDDDLAIAGDSDDDGVKRSPRKRGTSISSARRPRASASRNGPRWEDAASTSSGAEGDDQSPKASGADKPSSRRLKRQKSEASLGAVSTSSSNTVRRKSPSMMNLRKHG